MEKVHHVKHAQSAVTKAGRTILYRQNNNYSFVGTMAPKRQILGPRTTGLQCNKLWKTKSSSRELKQQNVGRTNKKQAHLDFGHFGEQP